jgi:hypothetical protein
MKPTPSARTSAPPELVPWYRVGVMWFVVGGLGAVVIGSFALLATAVRHMDTVESETVRPRIETVHQPSAPAMLARNHAATPAP